MRTSVCVCVCVCVCGGGETRVNTVCVNSQELCVYENSGRAASSPNPFSVVLHGSTATMDHADSDATGDRDWDSGRLLRLVLTDSAAIRAVWPPLVAYPPDEVREPRSG